MDAVHEQLQKVDYHKVFRKREIMEAIEELITIS